MKTMDDLKAIGAKVQALLKAEGVRLMVTPEHDECILFDLAQVPPGADAWASIASAYEDDTLPHLVLGLDGEFSAGFDPLGERY